MSLLPKNEPMEKDITPKVYFIWGQSMHGKTYLAKRFPNPIILNTDGNGKKIDTPHLDIFDFETFVQALKEVEEGKHTYQTVVVDLIDDIKTFMDEYIVKKYNEEIAKKDKNTTPAESIADIPFGKGFNESKTIWKRLMIKLSQLPYTVIFISHVIQTTDEYDKNTIIEQPSLEQKYLNMTKGRTDVMIKCQKVGKTYLQICNEKRDIYKKEDFKNKEILETLKNVKQLFEDNKPTIQELKKETKTIEYNPSEEVVEAIKDGTLDIIGKETNEALEKLVEEPKPQPKKSLLIKKEEV